MSCKRSCSICRHAENGRIVEAREMMFGLGDTFQYLECGECGCIQLLDAPNDWSRYYPSNYYSFSVPPEGVVKQLLKRVRARHALGSHSWLGAFLVRGWGIPLFATWLAPINLAWSAAILDVGSGSGHVLREMGNAGFSNLTGIDPHIARDTKLNNHARILKRHIREIDGPFDFVMISQSFEHMDDPEARLREVGRLLPSGKLLLLRIPVAGKAAWREYGPHWVQLDPPRHLFVHSEDSIRRLADRTGFTLKEVRYDSTGFQFWGSEQYRRGIPLQNPRSYAVNPNGSIFTSEQVAEYERRAIDLNEHSDGDQACFYLIRN